MIAIGLGTTRSATAAEIADAIDRARSTAGIGSDAASDVVAALARGEADAAIVAGAAIAGVAVRFLARDALARRAAECRTTSQASLETYGVPSVAECAALAGAGAGSRLIVPRLTFAHVTAAVAVAASTPHREMRP